MYGVHVVFVKIELHQRKLFHVVICFIDCDSGEPGLRDNILNGQKKNKKGNIIIFTDVVQNKKMSCENLKLTD